MAFVWVAWLFSYCCRSLFSYLNLDLYELEVQTASANAKLGRDPSRHCPPPRGNGETADLLNEGEECLIVSARDQAQNDIRESLTASSQLATIIWKLLMAMRQYGPPNPQAQQALDRDEHGLPTFTTGISSEASVLTSPPPVPIGSSGGRSGFPPSSRWPLSSPTPSPTRECLTPQSEESPFRSCYLDLARSDKVAGEGTRWRVGRVRGGRPQFITDPRPEAHVRSRAASIVSCSSEDDEDSWGSSSSVTLVPTPSQVSLGYGKNEPWVVAPVGFAGFAVPSVISVL